MRNHNHLLGSIQGVDGIKTGFTRASGFNLVTSGIAADAISSRYRLQTA
jgi:D-alanyl-D-alanine carboxypeptidase